MGYCPRGVKTPRMGQWMKNHILGKTPPSVFDAKANETSKAVPHHIVTPVCEIILY